MINLQLTCYKWIKILGRAYLLTFFQGPYWYFKICALLITYILLIPQINADHFVIPSLDKLEISTGRISFEYIYESERRYSPPLGLITTKGLIQFNCGLLSNERFECIEISQIKGSKGKKAKVWWYQQNYKLKSNYGSRSLFQLEVEGEILIDYKKQALLYRQQQEKRPFLIWYMLSILIILSYVFIQTIRLVNGEFSNLNKNN